MSNETLFLTLAEDADEQVVLFGPAGVTYANPAALRLFQLDAEGIRGLTPPDLLFPPPAHPPAVGVADFIGRVATMRPIGPLIRGTARRLADGVFWLMKGTLSLEAVGSLTAGLVHNLSGPLSIIRSTAEMMNHYFHRTMGKHPELAAELGNWPRTLREGCDSVINQVDLITEATRDLLAKIRGEAASREEELDLNEILQREVQFLRNDLRFKHKASVVFELAPDLPGVRGLYSDFSHSFRNIIQNAFQAMAECPQQVLGISSCREADHLVVRIMDTGRGIPAENLEKIFEPFFTHNGVTRGRFGLGLHSVRQLLLPYEVNLVVESEPGRTIFTLRLPLNKVTARA
ncbi:MAG: PAS domain-containing sensor histidine kinase [Deltaproteobacteria bacterium]|nr:PAS domain-containing sensor histidine kinase [Deltaproteobacteria bacterium]